jgi:Domain of unknown function (DUF4412)
MQRATIVLVAAGALIAASARLSAQGFDGVMQFVSYENHSDHPDTMTQITKGSKIRIEGMGRNGGAMIFDGANRIILLPEQKAYMDMPANLGEREATAEASKHRGTAERTGKTETIAGITCEDWHYKGTKSDGTPEEGDACVAKGAGMMINRLSGGMAGRYFDAAGPAFAEAIKNGAGVMKVTTNGKLSFVAIKAERSSVPEAMFAPPPDYTKMDMSQMGRPHKP